MAQEEDPKGFSITEEREPQSTKRGLFRKSRSPPNRREDEGLLRKMGEDVWGKGLRRKRSSSLLEKGREEKAIKRKVIFERNKTRKKREKSFQRIITRRTERESSGTNKERGREMVKSILCSSKTALKEVQKDSRLQSVERVPRDEILQNGGLRSGSRFNNRERLGHISGPYQCLQPSDRTPSISRFFSFPIFREDLRLQSDAIRAIFKPILLHEDDEVSHNLYQKQLESKISNIYGRHPDSSSGQGVPKYSYKANSGLSSVLGTYSESRKVRVGSQTTDNFSRMEVEPTVSKRDHDKREKIRNDTFVQLLGPRMFQRESSKDKKVCKFSRFFKLPETSIPACKLIHKKSLQYSDISIKGDRLQLERELFPLSEKQIGNPMVEKKHLVECSTTAPQINSATSHTNYRCIHDRLGSSPQDRGRGTRHLWPLFNTDKSSILQFQRDNCSVAGIKILPLSVSEKEDTVSVSSIRQPNYSSHIEQDSSQTQTSVTSEKDFLSSDQVRNPTLSSISSRSGKRKRRFSEPSRLIRRLSTRQRCLPKRYSDFTGFPNSGLFLYKGKSCSTSLCNSDEVRQSSSSECVQFQLEDAGTISTSANIVNNEVSKESNSRSDNGGDCDSGVARPTVVAFNSTVDNQKNKSRTKLTDIIARFSDEEEEPKTPTREFNYVSNFLGTISPEYFRSAAKWILDIASTRGIDMRVIIRYMQNFSREAFRRKLRGYLAFQKYCDLKRISIPIILQQDPIVLVSEFILFLQQKQVSDYVIADSRHAISTLFEDILGRPGIGRNRLVSAISIPRVLHIPHKSKYTKAWDINLLFTYYRSQPANSSMASFDVMIKAVILILVFTACRPREVVNIISDRIQYTSHTQSLVLPTVLKQSKNQITNLQVQNLDDVQICPVAATLEWLNRKKTLDPKAFLFTRNSSPIRNAQLLAAPIRLVLRAAGVPSTYGPYSIKHAVISALFHLGFSSTEINLFTGHSELADTAPKYYLKSINKWPGFRLAANNNNNSSPGSPEESVASGI
jgi:site-specific recombinase XerD